MNGTDKKIQVYTDIIETGTPVITLYGYDENGIWIQTQVSGAWIDGEQVALTGGPILSTKFFSSLTGV